MVALRYQGLDGGMKDIQTRWKSGPDAFAWHHSFEPATRPAGRTGSLPAGG